MKISLTQKISVLQDVVLQDLGDESILLNIEKEQYFGLDDVGNRMWQALTEAESIQAAKELLLAEYEVEPEQLQQDLQQLIEELVECGLVEITGA